MTGVVLRRRRPAANSRYEMNPPASCEGFRVDDMGGVPREQKMLKGYLPRVIYHQVY